MFDRPHHRRIASILSSLDADLLLAAGCYFGGGTAIALRYGEFRESSDIDFLVSDVSGYHDLRELVRGPAGINELMRREVAVVRPVVADRYGIRTILAVDGEPIKFEIVSEGRIILEKPSLDDLVSEVFALTPLDLAASKLLANSDRWADTSVHSRDLIDLAMMEPSKDLQLQAIAKAEKAYRTSVVTDLNRAINFLRDNPHRLDEYMRKLRMDALPKAVLWDRIDRLEVV